ncbi:alpha/beta hydrolase [Pseudomonas sp. CT11-2]|uniref:alpha/beta hydrolase n=1 Tax=Pseudomonas sp. CT11-2 TaxID=3243023 RepID=UPI0039AF9AE8
MKGLNFKLAYTLLSVALILTNGCSSGTTSTVTKDSSSDVAYAALSTEPVSEPVAEHALAEKLAFASLHSPNKVMPFNGRVVKSNESKDINGDSYYGVTVLYGTNRASIKNVGFGGGISDSMSYGSETVLIPKNRKRGEFRDKDSFFHKLKLIFNGDEESTGFIKLDSGKSEVLSEDQLLKKLSSQNSIAYGDILIFVHGFNVGFYEAVKRTGQVVYDLDLNVQPVLFSWPSQADPTKYGPDNRLAGESVRAFREFVQRISMTSKGRKIHVLAHSMGSQIVIPVMAELYSKNPVKFNKKFGNIILAAPDFDRDYFRREYSPSFENYGKATIYMSSDDRALSISSSSHLNDGQRLGFSGKEGFASPKIDAVDITQAVGIDDMLGHSRYGNSSRVLNDMHYLIGSALRANQRFGIDLNDNPTYWILTP